MRGTGEERGGLSAEIWRRHGRKVVIAAFMRPQIVWLIIKFSCAARRVARRSFRRNVQEQSLVDGLSAGEMDINCPAHGFVRAQYSFP